MRITEHYSGPLGTRLLSDIRYWNLYHGEITEQVIAAYHKELAMATTKKPKTKTKKPAKVKTGSGTLKFGSPEWQAKYGKGKKKAKK